MMTLERHNSFEQLSPQQCSPVYSSPEETPTNYSKPKEAIHYLPNFLDSDKLSVACGGDKVGFYSRLLSSAASFTLQELKPKDILEQELKMKQEQAAKETCFMQATPRNHNMNITVKTENSSRKRAATPDDFESKPSGRRYRTHFTSTQLDLLETTFQASKYPSSTLRQQVHEMTGIPKENIKVWFQNRRAREKRRKEKSNRLGLPSKDKTPAPVTTASSSLQPVAMTTMTMHWPEDSSSTVSSGPPPRYQNQWNTPHLQNRRNWYWANAYQPLEPVPASSSVPSPMNSFDSSPGMSYPMPHIAGHVSTDEKCEPISLSPVQLPVPVAQESYVNSADIMHPWTDNVLSSL